ncbi:MAG TPA: hypothetical protein VFM32_04680 [Spongiibacteraceae bacterium]|nr:hypothetical protein [Spongiibacteraceae bacterium]
MSPRALLILTPFAFVLCACQQAAWKAGANADDLKHDEQTCRAQSHDDQNATKQCLRAKGWTITEFNEPDDAAAAEMTTPTASTSQAPLEQSARENSESAVSAVGNETTANSAPSGLVAATSTRNTDPLQKQSVQTWWKAGAQAADFNKDAGVCLEQLGAQHTPDYAQHLYTRSMVSCLRTRGWIAGHDPVYTPLR